MSTDQHIHILGESGVESYPVLEVFRSDSDCAVFFLNEDGEERSVRVKPLLREFDAKISELRNQIELLESEARSLYDQREQTAYLAGRNFSASGYKKELLGIKNQLPDEDPKPKRRRRRTEAEIELFVESVKRFMISKSDDFTITDIRHELDTQDNTDYALILRAANGLTNKGYLDVVGKFYRGDIYKVTEKGKTLHEEMQIEGCVKAFD